MKSANLIGLLRIALLGEENPQVCNPTWNEVKESLLGLNQSDQGGFISLRDKDDTKSMIVFGEAGIFHIGIVAEDDADYVYCR